MINFDISKLFEYFKNWIDPSVQNNSPRKRNFSDNNREDDDDFEEDAPIVEPPFKRSRFSFFKEDEFTSPILRAGTSNTKNIYPRIHLHSTPNTMSAASKSSVPPFGGSSSRSHLEMPEISQKLNNKENFSSRRFIGEDNVQYLGELSKSSAIDPSFKFNPSICSTIRGSQILRKDATSKSIGSTRHSKMNIMEKRKVTPMKVQRFQTLLNRNNPKWSINRLFSTVSKANQYNNTPMQSHRLEERNLYKQLLQQHTSALVPPTSTKELRIAMRSQTYYTKEEQMAASSGALQKSTFDSRWTDRKRQTLDREDLQGTQFPKESISVLAAGAGTCSGINRGNRKAPVIDLKESSSCIKFDDDDDDIIITKEILPSKPRFLNSLERKLQKSPFFRYFNKSGDDWLKDSQENNREKSCHQKKQLEDAMRDRKSWEEHRKSKCHEDLMDSVEKRISLLDLKFPVPVIEISDEEDSLPELTPKIEKIIDRSLGNFAASAVLANKFNIQITRKDLHTLSGLNWLNDEVINFYMSLIVERNQNENKYPNVFSFSTFFYPKLVKMGYSSVKRWTKKVDIFSNDLLIIPVHLGMHWCLATIDFREKAIRYYDSMRGDNYRCLNELKSYLQSEHQDKKKSSYDASIFSTENVKDIPQQMNGSDCGMFSCKFAEYLSRDSKITFNQEHMPYFRRRMVYEIVSKTLM